MTKIQKLLFFIRVEELRNGSHPSNSFFRESGNFQAWIYGPVNPSSYFALQECFSKQNEKESYLLSEDEVSQIDRQYGAYLGKYASFSPDELIRRSHQNLAWIKARGNLGSDEVCKNELVEDEDFLIFVDEN